MEECNPTATPMGPHTHLFAEDRPETPVLSRRVRHRKLVGSFWYLAKWTLPELGFVCSQRAKHLSNLEEVHWTAAVRVLRYLRGTSSKSITYKHRASNGNVMERIVDADWTSDADSRRSIGAHVFLIVGEPCCGRPSSGIASPTLPRRASSWRQARSHLRPSGYDASSRALERHNLARLPSAGKTADANSFLSLPPTERRASRLTSSSTRSWNKSRRALFDSSSAQQRA